MSCKECNDNFKSYRITSDDCASLNTDRCNPLNATCVTYTGAALNCLEVTPNTDLETILLKIDEKVCINTNEGFSTYNLQCLTDDVTISTQKEFAEKVADEICQLKTQTGVDYQSQIDDINDTLDGIINPNLVSCTYIGITAADNWKTILQKTEAAVCTLHDLLDLSGIDWAVNFSITSTPTTIKQGFQEVLRQIGLVKNTATTLPTFNTLNSCLNTKNNTTSLQTVVNDLIAVACTNLTYDPDAFPWGCVAKPGNASLNSTISVLVSSVTDLINNQNSFDSNYFTSTTTGSCTGKEISLSSSITDSLGKVFANPTSTTKGTLSDVLEAGENITFDTTDPEKVVIKASYTPTNDGKVRVTSTGSLKYLADSVSGNNSDMVAVTVATISDKIQISTNVDVETVADNILSAIRDNPLLLEKLCNLICACTDCK